MEYSRNLNQGLHSAETQQENHNDLINENTSEAAPQQDVFNTTTNSSSHISQILQQQHKIKLATDAIRSRWRINLCLCFILFMFHTYFCSLLFQLHSLNRENQTENSFLFLFLYNVTYSLGFCFIFDCLYAMNQISTTSIQDYDPSVIPMLHHLLKVQKLFSVLGLDEILNINATATKELLLC